jgi:phosphohistidine phosphatase
VTAFRFYLVRHAEAEPSSGDDAARRLTPEGTARFAALVAALGGQVTVTRVLTSPLVRARETAALLAGATGAQVEEEPALAAGASSAQELLALARSRGEGVALVGHNPEVAEAVTAVARRHAGVSAGTIAAVDADAAGHLRLAWLKAPGRG